jgi:CubicO group peptidase (beta-lactamase class C family)
MFVGGIEPSALLDRIYDAPLEDGWVPGERAGYHPVTGFHVLGEIVRRVDGRAFDAYASEEIFEPLGMADSWIALSPERVRAYGDRLVAMHDTTTKPPRVIPRFLTDDGFSWIEPSSSGVGPMVDLVRLAEALRRGGELDGERILSAEAVAAMTARARVAMRDETFGAVMDWGLGVMVNSWHYAQKPTPYGYGEHAGRDAFGHGGRQSSLVFADPQHRLSVAFAANGMPGEPANHRRTQPVISALYEDLGLVQLSSRV